MLTCSHKVNVKKRYILFMRVTKMEIILQMLKK